MMAKEKVVFFLDYANINRAARDKRYRLDYRDLLQYVGEGRFLLDAHCYVPINPRNEHRLDGVIEELWRAGYVVTTKMGTIAGGTYKCNFDVEIAMDVLKAVYQVKPDIIVLATGDADFVSLILEDRRSGVRIEIAAFEESAGSEILSKCSGFINLGVYYDAYLAAQDGAQEKDRMTEQYKDLIQSQQDEPLEGGGGQQDQEEPHLHERERKDDEVKVPVEQQGRQIPVLAPDILDELEM